MDYDRTNDIRTHAVCNMALWKKGSTTAGAHNKNSKKKNSRMNACNIFHSKSHSAFYNIKQIESNAKYVKKQNITLSAHAKKQNFTISAVDSHSLTLTSFQNFCVFPKNQQTRKKNCDSKENQTLVGKNLFLHYLCFRTSSGQGQLPHEQCLPPMMNSSSRQIEAGAQRLEEGLKVRLENSLLFHIRHSQKYAV